MGNDRGIDYSYKLVFRINASFLVNAHMYSLLLLFSVNQVTISNK